MIAPRELPRWAVAGLCDGVPRDDARAWRRLGALDGPAVGVGGLEAEDGEAFEVDRSGEQAEIGGDQGFTRALNR